MRVAEWCQFIFNTNSGNSVIGNSEVGSYTRECSPESGRVVMANYKWPLTPHRRGRADKVLSRSVTVELYGRINT